MSRYRMTVSGCDDSTRIEVPERLVAAAVELAQMVSAASEYGCMPSAHVEKNDDPDADLDGWDGWEDWEDLT